MFRRFALLLVLVSVGGIASITGAAGENHGKSKDIGASAAVQLANVSLRAHLASANRSNTRHALTMEQLLREHTLTVDRNERPENACLYRNLYGGQVSLDQKLEARDLDIQKRLSAKTYYLVMYTPTKAMFDGGRYCVYVDAPTGKILRLEALLG